jgi:hypothetical protein
LGLLDEDPGFHVSTFYFGMCELAHP